MFSDVVMAYERNAVHYGWAHSYDKFSTIYENVLMVSWEWYTEFMLVVPPSLSPSPSPFELLFVFAIYTLLNIKY